MDAKSDKETEESPPINPESEQRSSFILQSNSGDDQHEETISTELEAPLLISQIYQEEFFDHFHLNYYGELEQGEFFLMSIRSVPLQSKDDQKNNQSIRVIIRTEKQDYDLTETTNFNDESHILMMLFNKIELPHIQYYGIVHHLKANEKILEHDKLINNEYSHKIGLVYQGLNQTTEEEILNNNQMSKEMEDFLNLISDRVELKDFHQYRGDLDVQSNEHGSHSYFTTYQNHQIMFNVSPIIPSDKHEQAFLHRKSLIANALICVVFQEQGAKFQPEFLSGKVTQVYLIVQPIERDSQRYYQIEICRRSDIKGIVVPSEGMFTREESFRTEFLRFLLKITNVILEKEFFQERIVKQRQTIRSQSLKKLCQTFYLHSKNQLAPTTSSSDEDLDSDLNKANRKDAQKHRRLTLLPKIMNTLSSNPKRNLSLSVPKKSPRHQRDSSQPSPDTPTPSLVTQFGHFLAAHTNTSTTNEQKRLPRVSRLNHHVEQLII